MDRSELDQWKSKEVARLLSLVETERRYYQEIVTNAPIAFLIVDQDQRIQRVNKAFRKLRGMKSEDLMNRPLAEVLPLAGLDEKVAQVLATGRPQGRLPARFQFGAKEIDCFISAQYHQGWEADSGSEALIIVEDLAGTGITTTALPSVVETQATPVAPAPVIPAPVIPAPVVEPVAIEPAPLAAVVPSLVNDIDAIVWECAADGSDPRALRFTYASEMAEELLGHPLGRWREDGFFLARVHEDDRERVEEFYKGVLTAGTSHVIEFRALTADGSAIWVREVVRVARDVVGRATRMTGLLLDVASRRLAEEQSIQTHKVEALGRLAGKVSHDFNNLLMIISGYTEEMKNSFPPGHPLHGDMQEIMRATERVQVLTNQLKQYTRKQQPQAKVVDINNLVRHLEPGLRQALGDGVEFKLDAESDGGFTKVDPALLEQALTTFALHAKFEMHGLGKVTLSTADLDQREDFGRGYARPGAYLILTISDNGPGLEPDHRTQLFEPWLISDETTREERLALASAYNIIKQSGGDVAVISEANKGTSFRITLPRAAEEPAPQMIETVTTQKAAQAAAEQDETALETILLVEDEAGIRALVRKILRRQGYTVLEASNGPDAIQICAQHKGQLDLLVTDVMMPQMSGRELAERLTAMRPELKVLYVSGYTDDAMLQSGSFPQGTAFLQKPFTLGSLLGKVRDVLDVITARRAGQ